MTGRAGAAVPGTGQPPARVAERARIVQLAADGLTDPQIADRVGCSTWCATTTQLTGTQRTWAMVME